MLKLQQHFNIRILVLFVATIILATFAAYISLKEILIKQYKSDLQTQIKLVSLSLPEGNFDEFAKQIKAKTALRITLIKSDGEVLGDSEVANLSQSHRYRPEVIEALRTQGFGYSVRKSDSTGEEYLYTAGVAGDILIRLAMDLNQVNENFIIIWKKILIIFALVLLLGYISSWLVNRKITKEVQKILFTLRAISNKEYKKEGKPEFASEFREISIEIGHLATKLFKKDKQKRKHTAKLKLLGKQRSDIIAAISHEFKNPIASIIGYSQTIIDDKGMLQDIKERFLEKIIQNSKKIDTMINRLSLATKLENNDLSAHFTNVDLTKLLIDVVGNFKQRYPNRKFATQFSQVSTQADPYLIESAINNIIENAIKYSDDTIIISLSSQAEISIKDNGKGIAPENLAKVTKKFYRENPRTWDNSMGLGLSIVNYILTLHKSNLKIESKLYSGSTFSFKL